MQRTTRRRKSLRIIAALAGAVMAGGLLAACAPPSDGGDGGDGGTLRFGISGGSQDQVNPYSAQSSPSIGALHKSLYNGLTTIDRDGSVKMELAESMEPNEAMDEWTVHLRKGVKTHQGNTFTADDAIRSIKYILDPANAFEPSTQINFVDPDGLKKVDDTTFTMKLTKPYGPITDAFSSDRLIMVAGDPSAKEPDGTGPFKIESFKAGQQATAKRHDGYFGEKPGFETLKTTYFQDQQALTNALRGGQIDLAFSVPYTDVDALKKVKGLEVLESDSATHLTIEMRVDVEPFSDVRVRTALKLAVDREQIVKNAFNGYATVANDFNGNNTSCAPPDVPQRTRDVEKAKQLLAEAGYPNGFSMELPTDDGFPGMLQTAQLFAQQAADIGVKVEPRKLDIGAFLDKWREWPSLIGNTSSPYMIVATQHFLPGSEENATHFDDPEYTALTDELYSTVDEDKQCAIIAKLQKIEYERGGDIVPIYQKAITVHSDKVKGLQPDLYGRTSTMYDGVTIG